MACLFVIILWNAYSQIIQRIACITYYYNTLQYITILWYIIFLLAILANVEREIWWTCWEFLVQNGVGKGVRPNRTDNSMASAEQIDAAGPTTHLARCGSALCKVNTVCSIGDWTRSCTARATAGTYTLNSLSIYSIYVILLYTSVFNTCAVDQY